MTTQVPVPRPPEPKRPYHVGVAIGATTGIFAISLLGASRVQYEVDRALIADRSPVERAITLLGTHHDAMDDEIERARDAYGDGAARYTAMTARLGELEVDLSTLSRAVMAVERLAAAVPASLGLPAIPTGKAYGGSGSTSGTKVKPIAAAPPPPAAAPPPTSGSTGASGAP